MPPARRRAKTRRAGYRPGKLSPQLQAAIADEARRLGEPDGPLEVIAAVGDVFASMDDAFAELALPRLRAIADLGWQGWSYDKIATETNLSKGRGRSWRARRGPASCSPFGDRLLPGQGDVDEVPGEGAGRRLGL